MHRTTSIAVVAFFYGTSLVSAALVDNFDSYATAAQFQAAWKPWSSNGSSMNLNMTGGKDGSRGVSGAVTVNGQMRNARDLDSYTQYLGTDANPVKFEFSLFDSNSVLPASPNGARNTNELRAYVGNGMRPYAEGSTNLQGVVAMGLYNSPVSDDNYHSRVYYGGVNAWYSLNTPRTSGWHTMTSLIGNSWIKFYVDGKLDTTVPLLNSTRLFAFDGVVLGSGLTSGGYDVAFDNLSVSTLPEPVTLLGFAVGGLLLKRRRHAAC